MVSLSFPLFSNWFPVASYYWFCMTSHLFQELSCRCSFVCNWARMVTSWFSKASHQLPMLSCCSPEDSCGFPMFSDYARTVSYLISLGCIVICYGFLWNSHGFRLVSQLLVRFRMSFCYSRSFPIHFIWIPVDFEGFIWFSWASYWCRMVLYWFRKVSFGSPKISSWCLMVPYVSRMALDSLRLVLFWMVPQWFGMVSFLKVWYLFHMVSFWVRMVSCGIPKDS